MPRPQAAVIIPCFNHGRFVAEAVRSCLAQAGADVQVIVVDDGSNDGFTPSACDECAAIDPQGRVRVVHQPNAGLPAARNAGAAIISREDWGEYLVFLDADDWIQPLFVAKLHGAIQAAVSADALSHAKISHAYCQERLVDRATGIWAVPDWDPVRLIVTNIHPVTALVRRSRFEQAGGFDPTMTRGYEDWDLWLKFAEHRWKGVRVREPLFVWRRHAELTMVVEAAARHDELYAMLVDRHRSFFHERADDALKLANSMLRRAEGAWLDEQGEPIVLRDARAWNKELVRERDLARERLEHMVQERAAELTKLEQTIREEYENKLAMRITRAYFRARERLFGRPNDDPAKGGRTGGTYTPGP